MDDALKALVKQMLHDNLEISVEHIYDDKDSLEVEIYFDGDCICADSFYFTD